MPRCLVREDAQGIYVLCEGYVVRPKNKSKFMKGDHANCNHAPGADVSVSAPKIGKEWWIIACENASSTT